MSNNPLLRWGLYLGLGGVVLLSEIAAGKTLGEVVQLKSLPALGYTGLGLIMLVTDSLPERSNSPRLEIERKARPGLDRGSSQVFNKKFVSLLAKASEGSKQR